MSNTNELQGLRPEDVKHTPAQQAQIDAYLAQQKADEAAMGKEEPIELMESEIMAVWEILRDLQTKYGHRQGSFNNLISLKHEADERFEKIGLQVVVDWVMPSISVKPTPPTITIVGRLAGHEYNPEQNRYEVGHGVADDYYNMKRAQQKTKSKLILPGQ